MWICFLLNIICSVGGSALDQHSSWHWGMAFFSFFLLYKYNSLTPCHSFRSRTVDPQQRVPRWSWHCCGCRCDLTWPRRHQKPMGTKGKVDTWIKCRCYMKTGSAIYWEKKSTQNSPFNALQKSGCVLGLFRTVKRVFTTIFLRSNGLASNPTTYWLVLLTM